MREKETHSGAKSELESFTDMTKEVLQTLYAEPHMSITTKDADDTCNAKIGNI